MKDGPEAGEGFRPAAAANGDRCDDGAGGAADKKGGDRSFTCRVCNRCFGYKHVLQNHERTHTGEKPFECPECGKRFTRDHHLKTHLRLHTGEKPYQCPHCERHFVQVANLRRHLRVHTGERPYACTADRCEARFSDSNQLKAHTLIHCGEKPYQCAECLGRFRRRHHLIHHRCPKDRDNNNRPRRGRRPKELHQLPPSDHEEEEEDLLEDPEELLHASDADENHLDTSNSSPEPEPLVAPTPVIVHPIVHNGLHPAANGLNGNGLAGLNGSNGLNGSGGLNGSSGLNGASVLNGDHVVVSSNGSGRRKPPRTIRILTPQQRELFLRDKVSMQTQALDMSLSPQNGAVTVLEDVHFLEDGVLDLSSSRSDSEADLVVVEPVRPAPVAACPCSLEAHLARRRPLSQRIASQRTTNGAPKVVVLPGGGPEDSGDHLLAKNGHDSEEENSVGPIPLTAKQKQHVSSSA